MKTRIVCTHCGWMGEEEELLIADHPFRAGEKTRYCPACKEPGTLEAVCDVEGCNEPVTALWGDGSASCDRHYLRRTEKDGSEVRK